MDFQKKHAHCSYPARIEMIHSPSVFFDSVAPARLIRWFSQPASPAELPVSSLFQPFPRSQFALRANLLVPLSKNSDFQILSERLISRSERQFQVLERLK